MMAKVYPISFDQYFDAIGSIFWHMHKLQLVPAGRIIGKPERVPVNLFADNLPTTHRQTTGGM